MCAYAYTYTYTLHLTIELMLVAYRGKSVAWQPQAGATVGDIRNFASNSFGIDQSTIRVLLGGKSIPATTPPTEQLPFPLPRKVLILATSAKQIETVRSAEHEAKRWTAAHSTLDTRKRAPMSTTKPLRYTFEDIQVLPYGDTEKARAYLERIRDDKAVQALMKTHGLKVGLLAELDPLTNTSSGERRLGLNENGGSVIRLRIRTDDYQGFCAYNDVKKVLCHELAHNTFGEHDDKFWRLCRQYEKDIVNLDPWRGGHSLLE